MRVFAEYVWIDGGSPTRGLRSKTKVLDMDHYFTEEWTPGEEASLFPEWGFDGSSTEQADGSFSDCILRPVRAILDPLRIGPEIQYEDSDGVSFTSNSPNYIVMCEVFNADGTPHKDNTRAVLREVLDSGAAEQEPWFGIEQEYTFFKDGRPLGWPVGGYPAPQGPFYCGVGADKVFGRPIVEDHMRACLTAGLLIAGVNAEVMPGQWEFQIGAGDPLKVGDHLWLARWLLYRIAEDYEVRVSLDPKPIQGDWNGSGAHTNFSTKWMREVAGSDWVADALNEGEVDTKLPLGMNAIEQACFKLEEKHLDHIDVYGAGIKERLTGKHETCAWNQYKWGVGNRGASIRIPLHVSQKGCGYLEDRRPCSNIDPYIVQSRILKTVCGVE